MKEKIEIFVIVRIMREFVKAALLTIKHFYYGILTDNEYINKWHPRTDIRLPFSEFQICFCALRKSPLTLSQCPICRVNGNTFV